MKQLLTLFAVLLLYTGTANAQSDMWYPRSASVEGIQFVENGTYFKPMQVVRWDWNGQCHCDDCHAGPGEYLTAEFNILIANPTIYPAIVDTAGKGYEADQCHYHFHSGLVQHTLYNIDGAVVAGGSKQGFDWVSSSTFNPDSGTNLWNEIRSIDPNWVYQDIPEVLPQYGQFVISGMRDDLYGRGFDGNRIILGHFIFGSYVGVKDGTYRLHSRAYFENLDLDEGANIYPNEWNIWIKIENDTVVTLDVPEPIMPIPDAPANFEVIYNKQSGHPVVVWSAARYATSYELERFIAKTGNLGLIKDLDTEFVAGTSFTDTKIILSKDLYAAQLNMNNKGWKAIYRIRAINNSGVSDWVDLKPKWIGLD